MRSDLRLPEALYDTLSIYLLLAIGLKGGVELARADLGAVFLQALPIVSIGLLLPLVAFPVLRWLGRLPVADAASIAAHYGSVSVATFAVGLVHLESLHRLGSTSAGVHGAAGNARDRRRYLAGTTVWPGTHCVEQSREHGRTPCSQHKRHTGTQRGAHRP